MFKIEWTKKHTTILIYTCATILAAVAIFLLCIFPEKFAAFLGGLLGAVSPVFFGFAIAYLLYPICRFFDKKFLKFVEKKRPRPYLKRALAVLLTLALVFALIALFISLLVPQIKTSYFDLQSKLDSYLQNASAWLSQLLVSINDDFGFLEQFATESDGSSAFDSNTIFDYLSGLAGSSFDFIGKFMQSVVEYSARVVSTMSKIVVSLIFTVYFLFEKEMLFGGIDRAANMFLTKKQNAGARKWISFTHASFGGFISGKILDAIIITLVNFIVFGLCGIPYYPLIALITGVTDIIPYFGPFLGAVPSVFIILIADPIKVILFLVMTLVIQQIDGNIIGPKILGEKVGVDSLMIIVAITITGKLWGLFGMFVGVPIFAIIYQAVKEFTEYLLAKKNLPTETAAYYDEKG